METVGVGQSETTVHEMVDFFLLLMPTGAGDELQGIKRGIMEMADMIAITKADGDNLRRAEIAQKELQGVVHLFPQTVTGGATEVLTCSAMTGAGIQEIWHSICEHREKLIEGGFLNRLRRRQTRNWMHDTIKSELEKSFFDDQKIQEVLEKIELSVEKGETSPFSGAQKLLDIYFASAK